MSVTKSDSIANLAAALVAAQAELRNPPKEQNNPFFKSKYADLATVREHVVPVFQRHGLAVTQLPTTEEGEPCLCSMLVHKSGEYISTTIQLHAVKKPVKAERPGPQEQAKPAEPQHDPQGVGAAITYARRYALQSIAGITADEDDDGNEASGNTTPRQQVQQQPQKAPPRAKEGENYAGIHPKSEFPAVFAAVNAASDKATLFAAWKRYEAIAGTCTDMEKDTITKAKDARKEALGLIAKVQA